MIHELHHLLNLAAGRMRRLRLWTSLALCWLFWAIVAAGAALLSHRFGWNFQQAVGWGAVAALATGYGCWFMSRRAARDPKRVAQQIERSHPELGAALLAALEQAPTPRFKRLGYLQSAVLRTAVDHGREHNWADAVPLRRVRLAQAGHLLALTALGAAGVMLAGAATASARLRPKGAEMPLIADGNFACTVEPGNAEIERGSTLLVIARFSGGVPGAAELAIVEGPGPASATPDAVRPMTRSLDDPQFVGRVPAVADQLSYNVRFAGQQSETYRITVFDYPELVRADATLNFPEFTRLDAKVIEDMRQVTAVEGTTVALTFRLNKDVADARLVDRGGEEVVLKRAAGGDSIYQTSFKLHASRRLKLRLVDDEGRKNKLPPEFVLNVTPNRPPTLKVAQPGRDVRVSPLEELIVAADATDDFGVLASGLTYSLGGAAPVEVTLPPADAEQPDGIEKQRPLLHVIDFESLAAEPDQLASYYVWAEDVGPDGERRRTMSDLYFAEVRRFDEVFRQGEQPTEQQMREQQAAAGQGGAAQQAEELAELQKQIASATWKLIRRESGTQPTPSYVEDASAVHESQQHVAQQLDTLKSQVTDADSLQFIEETEQHVAAAIEQLGLATGGAVAPLPGALSAEQAAYQSLLKLRAREFNVVRSNGQPGQSSGGGASGPSQRQLQQLELSADENRYETQSRAAAQRDPAAQQRLDESRQLLDRLRELARRQEDLNQRLRDLQSALQAAQDEQQRREIERELKRLRDQQREILRDADQLQGDMENSDNRDQLQSPREQLEQARERVQDASEALDEGQLPQAVTEGARAGQQLNQVRDQMRRQTADRFTDEMRELRDSAQQLEQRQQELSEGVSRLDAERTRSLRDEDPRDELAEGLQQQQQQLSETLERMRKTVEEAEEPEPLLARQLYDAVGEAVRDQPEEALDMTRRLVEAGAARDAAESMRQADRSIQRLREQIDQAADGVLGDQTEALRRAGDQLRQLANELNREIDAAQGKPGEGESNEQRPSADRETPPPSTARGLRGEQQDGAADGERDDPGADRSRETGRGRGASQSAESPDDQSPSGSGRQSNEPAEEDRSELESEQDDDARASGASSDRGQPGDRSQPEGREGSPPGPQQEGAGRAAGQPGQSNAGGDERSSESGAARGRADRLRQLEDLFGGGAAAGPGGPITGEDFRGWSQRMRDVEDMLDDTELGAEAARIRDRAEQARAEFKRHSRPPDWTKLRDLVAEPLNELRVRVAEEIRRQQSPDALAPIDRDSAPADYVEQVRRYYQRLGSGQ